MSIVKAQTLLRSLRWYHVGFAFVWAIMFGGLAAPYAGSSETYDLYSTCQQACVIVAVLAAVLVERRAPVFSPRYALPAGAILALGALAFRIVFFAGQPTVGGAALAGVLLGLAAGFFYVSWQQFFASEGASRTAIYIPLSAVLSVALSVALHALPEVAQAVCTIAVLPVAAAASLKLSLREIIAPDPSPRMTKALAAATVRDLWKPVFCTCAIGFVWQLVAGLFMVSADASSAAGIGGLALAAAVVLLIELFSERGFGVLRVYQVLFPLVAGVFMLPSLLGVQFAPLVVGMLLFGFEILNLLLIVTCAVYSSERNAPAVQVYALCVGPTLAAMFAGDLLGRQLNPIIAYDFALAVNVLFLCVYALSMVLFLVSFRRRGRASGAASAQGAAPIDVAVVGGSQPLAVVDAVSVAPVPNAPAPAAAAGEPDDAARWDARVDALGLVEPFSKREREVVALVLRGNNVPAIARKLYISENTVRDHMKSIYRKAGIHSRQELIDLFE